MRGAAVGLWGRGGSSSPAPVEHSRVIVSTLAVHDANGQPVVFKKLAGITRDPSTGNLYVVDDFASQIFMVTPDGLVTLVAGSTTYGFTDGDGTHAQFWYPYGVTIDATGALYVADDYNNAIRKLVNNQSDKSNPADWTVTTVAGSAVEGNVDTASPQPLTDARFSGPLDVVADGNTLYVADAVNGAIRKIDLAAGSVSTLVGPGTGSVVSGSSIYLPREVRLDVHGGLYVVDIHGLHHVSMTGDVTTLGSLDAAYAQDSAGNFFVADGDHTLSMITPSGQVSVLVGAAGSGHTDGTGDVAQLSAPVSIVLDEAHKTLYLTEFDILNKVNDIRKIVLP